MMSMLDNRERVEADDGYIGESPEFCKCPGSDTSYNCQKKMRAHVRMCHEHVNECFKNFQSMNVKFHHGITKHRLVFRAVAVVTQLLMESGESLMPLDDYDDWLTDNEVKALLGI